MTHYGVVGAMTAADLDLPALCAADHVHISGFYNFKGETALSSERNIWTRVECLDHQDLVASEPEPGPIAAPEPKLAPKPSSPCVWLEP